MLKISQMILLFMKRFVDVLQAISFDWSNIIDEIGIKTNDSTWFMISGRNISWSLIPQETIYNTVCL